MIGQAKKKPDRKSGFFLFIDLAFMTRVIRRSGWCCFLGVWLSCYCRCVWDSIQMFSFYLYSGDCFRCQSRIVRRSANRRFGANRRDLSCGGFCRRYRGFREYGIDNAVSHNRFFLDWRFSDRNAVSVIDSGFQWLWYSSNNRIINRRRLDSCIRLKDLFAREDFLLIYNYCFSR